MFKRLGSATVAILVLGALAGRPAAAQDLSWLSTPTGTTTNLGTLATTAGVVVLIIMLTGDDEEEKPARRHKAKAAELYLRHNQLQLVQDLSTGHGPLVAELATALEIRPENRPVFSRMLRDRRGELLSLASADSLTPERAVAFLRGIVSVMRSHEGLRADLDARVAREALN